MFKTLFHDLLESLKGEELELYNDSKIKQLLRGVQHDDTERQYLIRQG
ncbi:phage/plasmid replication protein, gene II/X family [Vibrio cholerae HC-46A1]|nr:phage/plasmid replication protein, gene II/X family [Vibrio cholerae HC-46A1]